MLSVDCLLFILSISVFCFFLDYFFQFSRRDIKIAYYKNRFEFKKSIFSIIKFPCTTITTGIHHFMQEKIHLCCCYEERIIHVCTKRLKGLNFRLYVPHVKYDAKF